MLTDVQRTELVNHGITYVRALISREQAVAIEGRIAELPRIRPMGDSTQAVALRHAREATGEPGDVCIMHPWTLHSIAMNCAERRRMMLSQTFLRDDNVYY